MYINCQILTKTDIITSLTTSVGLVIFLVFSSHLVFGQMVGEWLLSDYPESEVIDVHLDGENMFIVVNSRHVLEDTSKYDYSTCILEAFVGSSDEISFESVYFSNTGSTRNIVCELNKLNDKWIFVKSTFLPQHPDTFNVCTFGNYFDIIGTEMRVTNSPLFSYSSQVFDSVYYGMGSLVEPLDSLVIVRKMQDESVVNTIRTSPSLSFVTSIAYSVGFHSLFAFSFDGIGIFDDTLGFVRKIPAVATRTSTHGTLLSDASGIYSFGLNLYQSVEERDLVFHRYVDSTLIPTFTDSFGRPGLPDYPFIYRALDTTIDGYIVGGLLGSPSDLANRRPLKFFVARYSQKLNRLWYREYGGDESYLINGLKSLPDGRCLVYGSKNLSNTNIRYPYILIVDEQGQLSQTPSQFNARTDLFKFTGASTREALRINILEHIRNLRVLDVSGRVWLERFDLIPAALEFDMAQFPPGAYVVSAVGTEGQIQSAVTVVH